MAVMFRRASGLYVPASGGDWEDVTVDFSDMGPELATANRKVRMSLTGGDYGARIDTTNGASLTEMATSAFDGTMAILLRPQTGTTGNPDNTYVGIGNGIDIWNSGSTDVAQSNIGFCLYYGSRYIDLAATAKIGGFVAAPSLGGTTSASASRLGLFEILDSGHRIPYPTVTTLSYYPGIFPESESDTLKLGFIQTTQNHANNPPLIGQEWMYIEQEVDYRQNRGNANGRNRVDLWLRDGTHRSVETPLTWKSDWDFSYQYCAFYEYIGGLFNNPSTAHADNYFIVSHVIASNNRAINDRIGPPTGFLT